MERIVGSIVALVTPMHEDGSVDYETLRALVDWHIAEGTDCIVAVGTTGESAAVREPASAMPARYRLDAPAHRPGSVESFDSGTLE